MPVLLHIHDFRLTTISTVPWINPRKTRAALCRLGRLICPEFKRPQHHLELTADLESVRTSIQMAGGIYWAGKVRVLANEPPDLQVIGPRYRF
jgi:hypothetical protein